MLLVGKTSLIRINVKASGKGPAHLIRHTARNFGVKKTETLQVSLDKGWPNFIVIIEEENEFSCGAVQAGISGRTLSGAVQISYLQGQVREILRQVVVSTLSPV